IFDMKKIVSFLFSVLFLSTGIVLAQEARTITIQEAIEIALENNFQLKQAENNLGLAEESIKSEYADFLPYINSSLNGGRTAGQQFIPDQVTFGNVTSRSLGGNLNAGIVVFDGFNNINTLRLSQQTKISREESFQRSRENVIFNAASQYLQVLLSQQLLEISEGNLATSQKQLEQVQAQVEVGSRPSVDLYNQEAQVASDELSVTQQENSLRFNKLALIRQLQIDPLGDYQFVIPDFDEDRNVELAQSYNLSELIDEALFNRSDIKSELASIRGLNYQVQIAKGNLYPTVTASASLSTRYSDPYFLPNTNFGDQFFDQQINKSFGFSVNIPLFQNWNRMYNIEASKVQLKNAELSLENSRLQVIQEVAQAYNDFTSYTKQLSASEKALFASEKAFETQQERYNVGASTLIELSQAQANYVSAQSDHTSAVYNLIFQEKLLDYYLGKLNNENIEF
ncbi:MAG: TolC family protein, partial [Balneolaceae bacterium]